MSGTNLGLFWSYSGPARSYCTQIIVTSRYNFISISFITGTATTTPGTQESYCFQSLLPGSENCIHQGEMAGIICLLLLKKQNVSILYNLHVKVKRSPLTYKLARVLFTILFPIRCWFYSLRTHSLPPPCPFPQKVSIWSLLIPVFHGYKFPNTEFYRWRTCIVKQKRWNQSCFSVYVLIAIYMARSFYILCLFYYHFAIHTKYTYKILKTMRQGCPRKP